MNKTVRPRQVGVKVEAPAATAATRRRHRSKGSNASLSFTQSNRLLRPVSQQQFGTTHTTAPVLRTPQPETSTDLPRSFGIDTYPLLYLEVHLNGGVIAPLLIFQKDDSVQKAHDFCEEFDLDKERR